MNRSIWKSIVAVVILGLITLLCNFWILLIREQYVTPSHGTLLHGQSSHFLTKASNSHIAVTFTSASNRSRKGVYLSKGASNSSKSVLIDPKTFYGQYSKTEWTQALKKSGDRILNPHDFHYIINPTEYCKGFQNLFVTVIHTAAYNFDRRILIRETWGSIPKVFGIHQRRVFILGSPNGAAIQQRIQEEALQFGDIVQEDFIDTYFNLTYKNIMGLKWVHTYCKNAQFVLKSDDDAFVNIFRLMTHILLLPRNTKNMFSCKYNPKNQKVARFGKWDLTKEKYKDDIYPPYCPGLTYIMSGDVVSQLYKQSLKAPFFPLDDVYVTGILTHMLSIPVRDISKTYVEWENELDGLVDSNNTKIFGHAGNKGKYSWRSVWNNICQKEPTCHHI